MAKEQVYQGLYVAYAITRRAAKKAVGQAKCNYRNDLYEKLSKNNGDYYIYRPAQARAAATGYINLFRQARNNSGKLLLTSFQTFDQLRKHFKEFRSIRFRIQASSRVRCPIAPMPSATCREATAAVTKLKFASGNSNCSNLV